MAMDFGASSPRTMCRKEMITKATVAEIDFAAVSLTSKRVNSGWMR
jgi:hypothetical protein